jgi:hypothetical protein
MILLYILNILLVLLLKLRKLIKVEVTLPLVFLFMSNISDGELSVMICLVIKSTGCKLSLLENLVMNLV